MSTDIPKDPPKSKPKIYKQHEVLNDVFHLQKIFDSAAKAQNIFYTSLSEEATTAGTVSTGILCMDLLFGGGHLPGRFSYFYGPTGACKSTMLFHTIREASKKNIKCAFVDSEASTDPKYLRKLGVDLDRLKGARSKKGGWDEDPLLLHHFPLNANSAFDWMHQILTAMPDKIMLEDPKEGMRYFLVEAGYSYTPSWTSIVNGMKAGKIVEVEDASPQLFFLLDSIRMPTKAATEDLENNQPALLAKALHRGFGMVKSLLGKKMVNMVGTNHLTINPLDKYNKESEPGGEAVKFYPDTKTKLEVSKYKSKIITEAHVSGDGQDRYAPGKAYMIKNKGGTSHREIEYRVWLDEKGEPGRGICPVFDLFQFLTCTNQFGVADEKKGTFKILVPGYESEPLDYAAFKHWVLTTPEANKLKQDCKEQFQTGKAQAAYYEYNKSINNEDAKKAKAREKAKILGTSAIETDDDDGGNSRTRELEVSEDEVAL